METIPPALAHDCPFCGAAAGQACRTRNSGREQGHPHMRRIALTQAREQRSAEQALCCVCGNLRTYRGYTRRRRHG